MTREQFKALPHLVREQDVRALGYGRQTVAKFVDCGVLLRMSPAGCGQARYQKRQLAQLLKWEELLDTAGFHREPPMLDLKAVQRWTGWTDTTVMQIVRAGGLAFVKPPGSGHGKFLKKEVAALIGFEAFV